MKVNDVLNKLLRFRQVISLLLLCALFAILLPGTFLSPDNLRSVLFSISIQGIMVCGAVFPVLVGGIDRTVSGVAALGAAVCCALVSTGGFTPQSIVLGLALGLLLGAFSGFLHGMVLARFNIPAFLLTLVTSQILYGLVQTITGNQAIDVKDAKGFGLLGGHLLTIPVPVFFLFICLGVCYVLLNKTVYGRQLYYVGGNRGAAQLSGISVKKVIIIAYVISGLLATISGLLLSGVNRQASATQALGYENEVLAAVIVGGVSLRGGQGSILGAMFGALLIVILSNGMQLLGIAQVYGDLVKGLIIIAAIAADLYSSYWLNKSSQGNFLKWLLSNRSPLPAKKAQG